MAETKFFSAGRGLVRFNGVKIATLTGVRWTETVGRRRVQTIGELEAVERTAVSVDINWSVDFVKTTRLDERQLGLVGGRKTQDLIVAEPFTIEILDKATSPAAILYTLVECVYNGGSWNMVAGDIMTGSMNGDGRRMLHASEK